MSDLIRREDVAEALYQAIRTKLIGTFTDSMSLAIAMANNLPSVKLEMKWIPVTEALPEDGERVLTTIEVGSRGKKVRSGTYSKSLFQCDNGDVWVVTDKEVLAWMHCPEPWRDE